MSRSGSFEGKRGKRVLSHRSADIGVSKDSKIVGIRGRAVDRINKGRLGPKGLCSWEYNGHPDRLTFPVCSPTCCCSTA